MSLVELTKKLNVFARNQVTKLETPQITKGTITTTTIPISWGRIKNAVSYSIYRSATQNFEEATFVGKTTNLSGTLSGLTTGTTYYIFVVANTGSSKYIKSEAQLSMVSGTTL